jgi:hypothetical protein
MFGFLFAVVCLVLLYKVARAHGYLPGGHSWRGGGFGHRLGLRWLFHRLETSPGQERILEDAAHGLLDEGEKLKADLFHLREDLAEAVRTEPHDDAAVKRAFARQDERIAAFRKKLTESVAAVSSSLQPGQKRALAELLTYARFGRGPGRCGRYERREGYAR